MLKLELDSFDGVDESIQAFYEEKDGKYRLKVDGIEDTGALKRAKEHEVAARKQAQEEAKALKARLQEIEENSRKAAEDGLRKNGDVESLDKSWQEKLAKREKELLDQVNGRDNHIRKLLVDSVGIKIASDLALDGNTEVLLPHILSRLAVDFRDGEPVTVVKDKAGNLSALSVEELHEEFANNPAFASVIRGSKASGAGGADAKGGGAASLGGKKASEMSNTEKSDFISKNGLDAWTKKVQSNS